MSDRVKNIVGFKFGKLRVLKRFGLKNGEATWRCLCACGRKKTVVGCHLRRKTKPVVSCGCESLKNRFKVLDLTGQKFNRITVLSFAFMKKGRAYWNCLCECGAKRTYHSNKLRDRAYCRKCLVKDDLYWIQRWVKRNLLRKGARFESRRDLSVVDIVKLAVEAKKVFPYMSFVGKTKRGEYASIDRINSNKNYSDVRNIRIIPLWLNVAKMDLSTEKLKCYMGHYLKKREVNDTL